MLQPVVSDGANIRTMFYLGTHKPQWLSFSDVPLFVSARTLRKIKNLPHAKSQWCLDSGGFSELSLYGNWITTGESYAQEARYYKEVIGNLRWAAIQDWMCEPFMIKKTGRSIHYHQSATIYSLIELRSIAPDIPWIPIIQGYTISDYMNHLNQYALQGFDLTQEGIVGIGSVCRRQATGYAEDIIKSIYYEGINLHAFGFKVLGLSRVSNELLSADSMAWSRQARYGDSCPYSSNVNCANCWHYARQWYDRVNSLIC